MKIQAVTASLPLLDWRAVSEAGNRIPSIDPRKLRRSPFLKGFGPCGYRSFVSIPHREGETVFFEAKRGIQLPDNLPGGNAARRVLRRVYITGPQVRFELGLFARMRPEALRSSRHKTAARGWWSTVVKIRDHRLWRNVPLKHAASNLAERFRELTSVAAVPVGGEHNDVSPLPPQLLLTCLVPQVDVPPAATLIVEDPPAWLLFDSCNITHQPQPEIGFIFIEEAVVRHMGVERFSVIRRIRRELIWLHCDVQFLLEIGRVMATDSRSPDAALVEAAREVAESLSRLDENEAWGLEPLLFAAWSKAKTNQLELWRSQIGQGIASQTPLPRWLSGQPEHRTCESPRVYFPTLGHRLKGRDNHYPGDAALGLGQVALVGKNLLGDLPAAPYYTRERESAFKTYFGLPSHERTSISIVLPVRGAAFPLVACLESIARQSLVKACPQDVEVLIIEDGPVSTEQPLLPGQNVLSVLKNSALQDVTRRFVLLPGQGRSVARNVGIFKAAGKVIMFLDAWIVLEDDHLAEHVIRHHRVPSLALLGFKENLTLPDLSIESFRKIEPSTRRPDPRRDWKWKHVISRDEVGEGGLFRFRDRVHSAGETVNYMQLTNYLHDLSPCEPIGARSLPTFFQTNISTVPAWPLRQVGGFHSRAFKDNLWGLEDSHLGALLLAAGLYLVPCPSAMAFKIEHPEGPERREFDLVRHRQLYQELLHERMWQRAKEAEEEIQHLEESGVLQEIVIGPTTTLQRHQ